MDNLVKHGEYEVENDKPIKVNVPIIWLRDNTQPGDVLGLFEHPGTHQLIIEKITPSKEAS